MNSTTLVTAGLIATVYAGWGILAKWSGSSGVWISILVTFGTFAAAMTLSAPQLAKEPLIGTKALLILFLAGAANGAAMYFYSLKAADPMVPTGVFLMTVFVLMVVVTPILDWGLNGSMLSSRQVLGVGMAVVAIYLLGSGN